MKTLKILRLCRIASNTINQIYLGYMISTYLVKQVRAIDILHVG